MVSDEELVAQWRDGERGAGNELVDRHFVAISRYLRNKVRNPDDATDLVSQTFLACTTAKDRFRGETSFRRYLYAIADNVLRAHIRQRARGKLEEVDFEAVCVGELEAASPSSLVMDGRKAQAFVDALRLVPLEDQILLEHRYFGNHSAAEIAELRGVPAATVRWQLMRARDRLKERVAERLGTPGSASTPGPTHDDLDSWAAEVREHFGWNEAGGP